MKRDFFIQKRKNFKGRESRGGKPMGIIVTPKDIGKKKKIKEAARELGMDPDELEDLLKKGKTIRGKEVKG